MSNQVTIRRSIIIGIVLIAVSMLIFIKTSSKDEKVENKTSFRKLNVYTATVENTDKKLLIDLSGKLVAKNRIDIYSEVSGLLRSPNFREGQGFSKGQVLAQIDDSELLASVKSQKSVLLNNVAQILPDLAIDFPNEVEKWKAFHAAIDFDKSLPPLPEMADEKLKMFISNRSLLTTYFNIKSSELRLAKHTIIAPFNGVLSATNIDPGTLVRIGQQLGSFIQPNQYELEASISLDDLRFINVGGTVVLQSKELGKKWNGKVLRINEQLDPSTQSVKVYIGVSDPELKEGQYLTAVIQGTTLSQVAEIPRSLLLDNDEIFFIENDSILTRKQVDVVYKGTEWMYVKGLENGVTFLNQAVSSAHDGMIVSILNKDN